MMSGNQIGVLLVLAWRNLLSHKGKNTVVGLLIAFGAFLIVFTAALLGSIETSMTKSITQSLSGHLQVYDKNAKDSLALFGDAFIGASDIGSISDFKKVKEVIGAVPNVKAVIPMGIDMAQFSSISEIDRAIESLRQALTNDDNEKIELLSNKIRSMALNLKQEYDNQLKILFANSDIKEAVTYIERAASDEFWREIKDKKDESIEFLDTKLAPLANENNGYFLRYIGTDLFAFAKNFDRFEIVKGEMPPKGARGIIVSQTFYDSSMRNRVAKMMDSIKRQRTEQNKKIASNPLLQNMVDSMARQYRLITFQLDPKQAQELTAKLKAFMPNAKGELAELTRTFLKVTDDNFDERYLFFKTEIVPLIRLYYFDVKDVITLRSFTKSGYMKAINVKVWGTFKFKGLEGSDLAGAHSLIDMITFRDLYGMMTTEKREELRQIQREVAKKDVLEKDAEDRLFSSKDELETKVELKGGFNEFEGVDLRKEVEAGRILSTRAYSQEDIDSGIALNAAIVLKNPNQLNESKRAVEAAIAKAGLDLQVVDWYTASGIVGQLLMLIRAVLYVAILIIFLVALVIINNTMIMAAMERTMEIGTVRAIGGQRRFVLMLFLIETGLLGLIAGLVGSLLGAGLTALLGKIGIPATADILIFVFSGPRLYPEVGIIHVLAGCCITVAVILAATFYPALLATRIQPVVAMQARE